MADRTDALWQPDMLERYPMDSNAMVHGLDAERLDLLLAYVEEATMSDRLATLVAEVSRRYPSYLRVKELFETVEAYRRIGQHVYEQWKAGRVERVYEMCAGHGLLGILLACRFPKLAVLCVDAEHRPAFDHTVEIAGELNVELGNIAYVESDVADVPIEPRGYVIIIHGCNEVTQVALARAVAAGACFAAMPCCIRDGIYLRKIKHADDRQRYAAMVGVIAGQFGADKITAIDERFTNRHLIVLGAGR